MSIWLWQRTKLLAFPFILMSLRKAWIHLFFPSLWSKDRLVSWDLSGQLVKEKEKFWMQNQLSQRTVSCTWYQVTHYKVRDGIKGNYSAWHLYNLIKYAREAAHCQIITITLSDTIKGNYSQLYIDDLTGYQRGDEDWQITFTAMRDAMKINYTAW